MNNNKPNTSLYKIIRINEYLWLGFAIISIVLTIYSLITGNRDQGIYFLVLTFLSGFFYSFKRRQRKRYQERELNGDGNQKAGK